MQRREFLSSSLFASAALWTSRWPLARQVFSSTARAPGRKILITGGNFNEPFIRYMAPLTGKPRPRLLYLPTANADNVMASSTGSGRARRWR